MSGQQCCVVENKEKQYDLEENAAPFHVLSNLLAYMCQFGTHEHDSLSLIYVLFYIFYRTRRIKF